ncbi:MAG TPA: hypothetical protein VM223_20770 [Planctomycetota bacterium]|nr:hypothetical protein [Planctomycetota bacterium]
MDPQISQIAQMNHEEEEEGDNEGTEERGRKKEGGVTHSHQ